MPISRKKPLVCPIEVALNVVAARWKARIVYQLAAEPKSFTQLRAGIDGISDRMLTTQLSQLVDDAVVLQGTDTDEKHYRLTALGLALLPVLAAMYDWGELAIERRTASGERAREVSFAPSHRQAADAGDGN